MKPTVRKLITAAAAVAVPAALYAVDYVNVPGYGWFGSAHSGAYGGTIAVGFNNVVSPGTSGMGTAAIGTGLRAEWANSLVVGQYNSTVTGGTPLFVVGNGENNDQRKNAMEVWSNGTVVIGKVPEKGGVPMGEFTAN